MKPFVSLWETTAAAETITLPTATNYVVDWGDGTITDNTNNHEYANIGQYEIKIKGEITDFVFNSIGDRLKIKNVSQWGGLELRGQTFYGCTNMDFTAIDTAKISKIYNSLYRLFRSASLLVGNSSINTWDVSNVANLSQIFYGASLFNEPIGNWDTSNSTTLDYLLYSATIFNQDVSTWNTSNVTRMNRTFAYARAFNYPLNDWDVSNVFDMTELFFNTDNFNQDLNSWNTVSMVNMSSVFYEAHAFNGNISSWNTSNATTFYRFFRGAYAFNQDISGWDTSNVTSMYYMFYQASAFNQDISNWDFSSVKVLTAFMNAKSGASYNSAYYDNLLIKWDNVVGGLVFANMTDVNIGMGGIKYTAAGAAARASLVGKGFIISDGGQV